MRFFLTGYVIVLLLVACKQPVKGRNGEVYRNAVEYNDYIVGRQSKVVNYLIGYANLASSNSDSVYQLLTQYEQQTGDIINEVKAMPSYKGDSSFRDAGAAILIFYKKLFSTSYKRMMDIRRAGEGETEERRAEMEKISEEITKEEEVYDKRLHNAQLKFGNDNNIRIMKNKLQDEIDK